VKGAGGVKPEKVQGELNHRSNCAKVQHVWRIAITQPS
jgi:hypothetical protein